MKGIEKIYGHLVLNLGNEKYDHMKISDLKDISEIVYCYIVTQKEDVKKIIEEGGIDNGR